jgi:5-methylcytosine-specific restriction endonuclease McrA
VRALVLNQDFRPISVCSIQRAFVFVFMDKVEMVTSFNGNKFHTVDQEYNIPAVVRLQRYVNVPFRGVELSRLNIFKRDGHECQYCGAKSDLSIDHVLPRSRKGPTSWENCVTSCFKCNNKKSNKTPREAGLTLMNKPKKPKWNPVFHVRSNDRPDSWGVLLNKSW